MGQRVQKIFEHEPNTVKQTELNYETNYHDGNLISDLFDSFESLAGRYPTTMYLLASIGSIYITYKLFDPTRYQLLKPKKMNQKVSVDWNDVVRKRK